MTYDDPCFKSLHLQIIFDIFTDLFLHVND